MWSIACIAKLKVMNSTIGRSPPIAAPVPIAGEAIFGDRRVDHAACRRTLPASLGSPCRHPDIARPPRPSRTRGRRRRISSAIASRNASRTVCLYQLRAFGGTSGSATTPPSSTASDEIWRAPVSILLAAEGSSPLPPGEMGPARPRPRVAPLAGALAPLPRSAFARTSASFGPGAAPRRLSSSVLRQHRMITAPTFTACRVLLGDHASGRSYPRRSPRYSIVALSVSISARMSPDFTCVAFLHQPPGERALFHGRARARAS